MTEDEAITKWCPQVRFVIGPQSSTWQERAFDNRAEFGSANCVASGCMAWRWWSLGHPNEKQKGYCGLAGKP